MKVAIAEYGLEGQASYRYYLERGHDVTIVTNRISPDYPLPDDAKSMVSPDVFDELLDFDIVLRSPPRRPDTIKTTGRIWSATNEFFAQCPAEIIGVTGTKGKGTTSSMIAAILQEAGKTVHLVGNIGKPALELLESIQPGDIVVYELSSFQLWDLQKSPQTAVILGIEPDHLDVHADFSEYLAAKGNIRKHQAQDDVCYYHPTNEFSHQIAMSGDWPEDDEEQKIWQAQAFRYATPEAVYVKNGNFMVRDDIICPTSAVQLPGDFNIENACAAISAARNFTVDTGAIESGLRVFTGLPHRLKFIREVNGVSYYDDSIATTPGSAIAAMRSFGAPKILILGGSDKGAEYDEVVRAAKETGTRVISIGQTGGRIKELCDTEGIDVVREEGLMSAVVSRAATMGNSGDVVILSPASASFDQYKNYADRGDQFIAAVGEL